METSHSKQQVSELFTGNYSNRTEMGESAYNTSESKKINIKFFHGFILMLNFCIEEILINIDWLMLGEIPKFLINYWSGLRSNDNLQIYWFSFPPNPRMTDTDC